MKYCKEPTARALRRDVTVETGDEGLVLGGLEGFVWPHMIQHTCTDASSLLLLCD